MRAVTAKVCALIINTSTVAVAYTVVDNDAIKQRAATPAPGPLAWVHCANPF